jgi:glutathione synthase/RimK-type ligase-like ATP-grasp enzyme
MKMYSYKVGSASAKALAAALGIKRIKHDGKKLQVRGGILNWGASRFKRDLAHDGVLNPPDRVAIASNKLETFKALDGEVNIPEWAECPVKAAKWLADGFDVVCRLKLNGHSGEGIELVKGGEGVEFPDAPLYTKYIKKKDEFRIHVFQGNAFFIQRKARNKDIPDDQVNWKIRNHSNGFIFAHKDVEVDDEAKRNACDAVACLGLDFGAVDIVLGTDRKWYVLEVNTACGLEGTTLEKCVEQFKKYL